MSPDLFKVLSEGMAQPEASVLIPVFRSPRLAVLSIESVLNQHDVILELLVSDDASGDDTADRVIDYLQRVKGPHRIVFRSGSTRLERDHFILLTEAAACDITIMAHQDDLSFPHRARTLIDLFNQTGADVVSSHFQPLRHDGVPGNLRPAAWASGFIAAEGMIRHGWQTFMLGATQAWRRSVYSAYPRLDRTYLARGHDFLVAFRGALGSGFYYHDQPLLLRRHHPLQWSQQERLLRADSIQEKESAYSRLYAAMLADLFHLKSRMGGLENARFCELEALVSQKSLENAAEVLHDTIQP